MVNYDGNTYSIKNIEINSKNTVAGLFGNIIGAKGQQCNFVFGKRKLYSSDTSGSERGWHVHGRDVRTCSSRKGEIHAEDVKISNCTVSGYTIRDNTA